MNIKVKKGSGKQIFLKILYELSTRKTPDIENKTFDYDKLSKNHIGDKVINSIEEINNATNRLRAGMLVHGGTSSESHELINILKWGSSKEDNEVWRQGIATNKGNVFLTDVFELVWQDSDLKERIINKINKTTKFDDIDYEAIMNAMWLILSATQMFEELLNVETVDEIDLDRWVDSQLNIHKWYFIEKN